MWTSEEVEAYQRTFKRRTWIAIAVFIGAFALLLTNSILMVAGLNEVARQLELPSLYLLAVVFPLALYLGLKAGRCPACKKSLGGGFRSLPHCASCGLKIRPKKAAKHPDNALWRWADENEAHARDKENITYLEKGIKLVLGAGLTLLVPYILIALAVRSDSFQLFDEQLLFFKGMLLIGAYIYVLFFWLQCVGAMRRCPACSHRLWTIMPVHCPWCSAKLLESTEPVKAALWKLRIAKAVVTIGAISLPIGVARLASEPFYGTSVERALLENDLDELRELVEEGESLTKPGKYDFSPIEWALHHKNPELLAFLIEHGADPNEVDQTLSWTPLIRAARDGQEEMATILLDHGADPNGRERDPDAEVDSSLDRTPLMFAAQTGDTAMLALLIDRGADVNAVGKWSTALIEALSEGKQDTAKYLVQAGAGVNVPSRLGQTPLMEAAANGNQETVLWLLSLGAAPNSVSERQTPLIEAAEDGHTEVVEILLEAGADPLKKSTDGHTSLMAAARSGDLALVKLFLDKGVSLSAQTDDGWTVLMSAARSGKPEVTRFFVERGLDAKAETEDGATVLSAATFSGSLAVVEYLLSLGVPVNVGRTCCNMPLLIASEEGYVDIASRLIQAGIKVNAQSEDGARTALHRAAYFGHAEIVKLLLVSGADRTLKTEDGETPLDMAKRREREEIVQLLEGSGT